MTYFFCCCADVAQELSMALGKKCHDNSGQTAHSAAAALLKIAQVVHLFCIFRELVIMSSLPCNKCLYKMQCSHSLRMGRLKFLASCVRYIGERACAWSASLEMLAAVGDSRFWWGCAHCPPCDKEEEQNQLLTKISERSMCCSDPEQVKNPW